MSDVVSERIAASSDAAQTRRARRERERTAAHAGESADVPMTSIGDEEPLLTADDVRDARFHTTTRDVSGYDQREVDAFLELVQQTLHRLHAERAARAAGRPAPAAVPSPAGPVGDEAHAPQSHRLPEHDDRTGHDDGTAHHGPDGLTPDHEPAADARAAEHAVEAPAAEAARSEAPETDAPQTGAAETAEPAFEVPAFEVPAFEVPTLAEPAAEDTTMVLPAAVPPVIDHVPSGDEGADGEADGFRHEPATPPPGVPALVEDDDDDLTGDDVRQVRFPMVRGEVGYVVTEIDDFLDRLATSLDARWYQGTPDLDAAAVEAARFRTTWRGGYDQDAVDDLLERAADALRNA